MAGQTPGRKEWRLFREPIGNIQSLGLAEDGCPESQVILAKHLLEQNSDERGNGEEKARLGVYWLMKASEKGHEEATRILRNCLQTGRGISEQNVDDVRACLNMSQGEKVSREAARELFSSLSQGEDFVTSGQIIEEMRKCSRGSSTTDSETERVERWEEEDDSWEGRSGEKVTEEMLVRAASTHSRGELPLVVRLPVAPRWLRVGPASSLLSPLPSATPTLLLLALALFGFDTLLDAAPSLLYYASLTTMVITSCQVLSKKWEFDHFRQWSNLLVRWGCPESNCTDAEWAHCTSSARPCFFFMAALLVNLLVSPFVVTILFSEVTLLSTLMSLLLLYNFAWYKKRFDFLILFSFIVHLLARYPYEIDTVVSQYWRYLDVHTPTFASFIVGNSVEFCLNFRLVFYLLMPVVLLKLGSRENWLGVFTVLLPHVVSLSWWQNAVLASNGVTQYGLIRGCLAIVGVVLFLPLAGLIAVIVPLAAVVKFISSQQISTSFALSAASIITLIYMGTRSSRTNRLCTALQVGVCVLSVWVVVNCGEEPTSEIGLDWREYSEICRGQTIHEQEACSSLVGLRVSWEGRFLSARLASVHNPIAPIIQRLPKSIGDVVTCMWGERFSDSFQNHSASRRSALISSCHLANWNKYEYEMEVELEGGDGWGSESRVAIVRGGNQLRKLGLSLERGDRVWFTGFVIPSSKPASEPVVALLKADSLVSAQSPPVTLTPPLSPSTLISTTFKPIFNFIFNPVAILR